LRSRPALADRLVQAELKLTAEAERAAVDGGAGETQIPRSLEFYEQFATTISARFQENSRETRTTLVDLIGRAIRLIPKEAARELDVCCALIAEHAQLRSAITRDKRRLSRYAVRKKSPATNTERPKTRESRSTQIACVIKIKSCPAAQSVPDKFIPKKSDRYKDQIG
jgi:hypothetical protein